jgi:hypothetical protein
MVSNLAIILLSSFSRTKIFFLYDCSNIINMILYLEEKLLRNNQRIAAVRGIEYRMVFAYYFKVE